MPLSARSASRVRKHSRSARSEGRARAVGLWDVGAQLTEIKLDCFAPDGSAAVHRYDPSRQRETKTGSD